MLTPVCTMVVLHRPGHSWPLLLAANRDEMADRAWRAPGRHWPLQPEVTGGLDITAGGTWLARNDAGVIAAVLNRINTLGPAPGRRSRGELPLRALAAGNAGEAARLIAAIEAAAWRPFNMVVADARQAFWIRASGDDEAAGGEWPPAGVSAGPGGRPVIERLPAGLSMITAHDRNDTRSPRIRRYLPRFGAARAPRPGQSDWEEWVALMAARESDADVGPGGAMTVITASGFGTVCASLLALPADDAPPVWLFAAGRPGEVPFATLDDG